mmetsp:Transcript_33948/g.81234  ORF Transcript_33948/g.81234 Transcript_33948/m.81234 type:complete len:460 (+) Transcript_33948:455-1834(+)
MMTKKGSTVATSPRAGGRTNPFLATLSLLIVAIPIFNYVIMSTHLSFGNGDPPPSQPEYVSPMLKKAQSINSYWWPDPKTGGGILGKIYLSQHPPVEECSRKETKFFIWRSLKDNENDTRGLTAWAHAFYSHLMHALSDGDKFEKGVVGSRIILQDDLLWPMAKGCIHKDPDGRSIQTRECYFEPLSSCKLSDVDKIDFDPKNKAVQVLKSHDSDYDRSARTVYSSHSIWFKLTRMKFAFTGLPKTGHSEMTISAASLAYYFRPKPWLVKEIDERIRNSIPADLNPDRTIGVPIRRSDKCHGHSIKGSARGELDCPSLPKYLEGIKHFLDLDPLIENVIVTSEDKSACDEFLVLVRQELPKLRVIINEGDVQQGTGSGSKLESYVQGAANANVIASALTSMHLHLRARYFVVTSKSTWTSTIAVMARTYGFASDVMVIDIGPNVNTFSNLARVGCPIDK